jgi:hypothetical protein
VVEGQTKGKCLVEANKEEEEGGGTGEKLLS